MDGFNLRPAGDALRILAHGPSPTDQASGACLEAIDPQITTIDINGGPIAGPRDGCAGIFETGLYRLAGDAVQAGQYHASNAAE